MFLVFSVSTRVIVVWCFGCQCHDAPLCGSGLNCFLFLHRFCRVFSVPVWVFYPFCRGCLVGRLLGGVLGVFPFWLLAPRRSLPGWKCLYVRLSVLCVSCSVLCSHVSVCSLPATVVSLPDYRCWVPGMLRVPAVPAGVLWSGFGALCSRLERGIQQGSAKQACERELWMRSAAQEG